MDLINSILNDKSENDKKLVKELSRYLRRFVNSSQRINKDFVNEIADIVLKNYEVQYNDLQFNNEDLCGSWNDDDFVLSFNLAQIIKNAKEHGKHQKNFYNVISVFYVIETIVHEITHARQSFINSKPFNSIMNSCIDLLNQNYEAYIRNWEYVLIERYARLRGCLIAYNAVSYVYPEEDLEYVKTYTFYQFMLGYKVCNGNVITPAGEDYKLNSDTEIISPLETYNLLMELNSMPTINFLLPDDLDLYSRLYLGVSITTDEFKAVDEIYQDLYFNNTPIGNVRELINNKKTH